MINALPTVNVSISGVHFSLFSVRIVPGDFRPDLMGAGGEVTGSLDQMFAIYVLI